MRLENSKEIQFEYMAHFDCEINMRRGVRELTPVKERVLCIHSGINPVKAIKLEPCAQNRKQHPVPPQSKTVPPPK